MIGQRLGHYRIEEKIGAGGMGEVYRARDEHLNRDVAIKVLPAGTLADEQARRRFRKEAEALSKLNHPNIQTIHDFDTQEGVDFLVVEFVPGPTLAAKLHAGALPEKETASLGAQIAAALEEAHERGVVHRDLKPGNIKVTPKGQVKILDFGIAKLLRPLSEATTQSFTESHLLAGTLPYMSPEHLRGEAVDARSDLYSFGVVLYELATGRRPFEQKVSTALSDAILHQPAPSPARLKPDLAPRLEEIILKCLEKAPENRYQSAKELAVDLRRLAAPAVLVSPRPGPRGSTWWAVRLAGLGLAAVAVLLGMLVGLNVGDVRARLLGRAGPPQIQSIAVLPLQNLSGDPEQEYFVDGMHEALIAELSKISALRVISRTSAMHYKGTDKALPQIARELGVDAVVEGSVLRAGNRVRVTAQLVAAVPEERHLWANSFDRELKDILALHSEVARAIANQIRVKVTPEEQARLTRVRTVDPEAYQLYLEGRYYLEKWTEEGFKKAIEYFQKAVDLDPTYAPAYAGLADYYALMPLFGHLPPTEAMPRARAAALKAIELDEMLAEGHAALGLVKHGFDWDWVGAERQLKRARELSPNSPEVYDTWGFYLPCMGRFEESIAATERAIELDPLSVTRNLQLGWVYYYAGRHDESIRQLKKTLELDPTLGFIYMELGWNYSARGMHTEAASACEKAVDLMPEDQVVLGSCAGVLALAGRRRKALDLLEKVIGLSKQRYLDPYNVASAYDGLGDRNSALQWLEQAYAIRSASMPGLKIERWQFSQELRSDPRFQDLVRRMNYPE